jgi:hypothetical protein
MKKNKLMLLFSIASLASANHAMAADTTWSGFLSASIGKTLDTDKTYLVDPVTNASYTDEWQSEPESMIGLQATSVISDKMRTTVQMLAKGYDNYNVNVDLAFLSYALTDTVTLNMGRFRLPFYHYSSFIDVGYAYHWVRAPMDYYSLPHTSLDGANVRYADYLFDSDVEIELQAWYGNSNLISVTEDANGEEQTTELSVRKDVGLTATFTWEWLKFRLLHNEKVIGFGAGFEPSDTEYDAIGFMADYENVIFRSEYAELKNDFAPDATPSWYLSAGYQIGNFLPHVTYSKSDPGLTLDFNSFEEDPVLGPVPTFNSVNIDTVVDSLTIGVRWDVHANTAIKAEYISRETETEVFGFFDNAYRETITEEVNVFALSVDVVF